MEEYGNKAAEFWGEYGVSYQILHQKTQEFRNILNKRGTDQNELPEEVGAEIIAWFHGKVLEKSESEEFKKEDHIDKLFPTEAEIIEMLESKNIGKKPIEPEEKTIKMSEIHPYLGGKRRKKKRRRTKKRKRRRTKKKRRRTKKRRKRRRRN